MSTYIVSGYMRSGTSMMMGALIAGGLEAVYDERRRDGLNKTWAADGYTPNEAYYEPSADDLKRGDFPRGHDDKLLKVLIGGIPRLAPLSGGMRVVVMKRDPEEIRQSYEGFFHGKRAPSFLSDGGYDEKIQLALDHLGNRRDVESVKVLGYRDVVDDPVTAFASLGWPIDIEAASAHIDPALCRYRLENLEVGI